jgi:hypothetical protein
VTSEIKNIIANLNHPDMNIRLDSLKKIMTNISAGEITRPQKGMDFNNHIHTNYSFSPYSPTKAIWMAYQAGLATAGLMDHDSISGAKEFIEAGKIAGIATTIGVECRGDFSATLVNGKKINNPDQNSNAYIAIHGIPHTQIERVQAYFKPYQNYRNIRNQQMVAAINQLVKSSGIALNFETDIIPLSKYDEGGSITERHILYALSLKLIERYGKGNRLIHCLANQLKIKSSPKLEAYLTDIANPYYDYDLLGLLKSEFVSSFYIKATHECPDVKEIIKFASEIGAVSAYPYLGDVGDSVTGDKKTQKFEDDYLDLLFEVLKELQFNAVTYMPSRNSFKQLERVRNLCNQYHFFQISGEDINSPRQSFIYQSLRDERFQNLRDAAWALIGHEITATENIKQGMFSESPINQYPDLKERINRYRDIGLRSDNQNEA